MFLCFFWWDVDSFVWFFRSLGIWVGAFIFFTLRKTAVISGDFLIFFEGKRWFRYRFVILVRLLRDGVVRVGCVYGIFRI